MPPTSPMGRNVLHHLVPHGTLVRPTCTTVTFILSAFILRRFAIAALYYCSTSCIWDKESSCHLVRHSKVYSASLSPLCTHACTCAHTGPQSHQSAKRPSGHALRGCGLAQSRKPRVHHHRHTLDGHRRGKISFLYL